MNSNEDKSMAVIGLGIMGRGAAEVFALAGYDVYMYDKIPAVVETAPGHICRALERAVSRGKISPIDSAAARDRLHPVAVKSDVGLRDFILEAVSEDLDEKTEVLGWAEPHLTQGGILATTTSTMSITQLAKGLGEPDLFVGMHFVPPVPAMRLVEVVRGSQTSEDTVKRAIALAESVGKEPVVCDDQPGFVCNRVSMAMINEAIFAAADGVADPEAIDKIMRSGMNLPMGPLAVADLIGLDVCLAIMEALHRNLRDPRYRPCPTLREMVEDGCLGRKTKKGFHTYE